MSPVGCSLVVFASAALPSCCIWQRSIRLRISGTQLTSTNALASTSICHGSTQLSVCMDPRCSGYGVWSLTPVCELLLPALKKWIQLEEVYKGNAPLADLDFTWFLLPFIVYLGICFTIHCYWSQHNEIEWYPLTGNKLCCGFQKRYLVLCHFRF